MEAKEATRTGPSRTEREDFQATSDPALQSADQGKVKLLGYDELYGLWERQQWLTQELDFSQDRTDWHEKIPEEERYQRLYGLSSFFIGEQKVADELGPMMRAAPLENQRIFLATQIADEARHVRFFDRFFEEVGVLENAGELRQRLDALEENLNPAFNELFDDLLKSRVDRLAEEPGDQKALIEAVTLYHMVIEGMLALTGQHFIIDYLERNDLLPGFREGFGNVARDEHRHVAYGTWFLKERCGSDPAMAERMRATLHELLPVASGVLVPKGADPENWTLLDYSSEQVNEFAFKALSRRLKAIGVPLLVEQPSVPA